MKWVKDTTGRLAVRPHYDPGELDLACESFVIDFLVRRYDKAAFPVSTNDLTILLEEEANDLDLFSDLSGIGPDVEGCTDFFLDRKPNVRISVDLSTDTKRENRYRTTLSHELSHVRFHAPLWKSRQPTIPGLGPVGPLYSQRCTRSAVHGSGTRDWLEWQAAYCSSAILMPATHTTLLVRQCLEGTDTYSPIEGSHPAAQELVRSVQRRFLVSAEAARIRLLQMGFLTAHAVATRSLFVQEQP